MPHVTPFTESGELDTNSLISLVERFDAVENFGGLVSCARVGERPVLTSDEQLEVFEPVAETKSSDLPLVSGIAPQLTETAIEMIADVEKTGADAVLVFPPLHFAWGT